MKDLRLLVADDESISLDFLSDALRLLGADVSTARDGREAINRLQSQTFDQVWTDLQMPGLTGRDVLKAAKNQDPDRPVVIVTAHGTMHTAVELLRSGADDILEKPATIEDLELAVTRASERGQLRRENRLHRERQKPRSSDLVAESPAMRGLLEQVARVAKSEAAVLITGPSGVGKERISAEIHRLSDRVDGPFVEVNAAAVPDNLAESEFFGHEPGAFTGAQKRRLGWFELADGGTLFLDEVGELPANLQAKLLRVLQEGTFRRVGGEQSLAADVRIVAATNRDLEEEVRQGRFREDLYYRLNVVPLQVPALRDRREDVLPLADRFAGGAERFDRLARDAMLMHGWPGNVRELQNRVERAVLLHDGDVITASDLGLEDATISGPQGAANSSSMTASNSADPIAELVGEELRDVENRLILQTLAHCSGNRTKAASVLGIGVRTLYDRLRRLEAST
ncbi:MAG: sigma-54 dependent transcriptional regulator [Planctomycetota bacterium]